MIFILVIGLLSTIGASQEHNRQDRALGQCNGAQNSAFRTVAFYLNQLCGTGMDLKTCSSWISTPVSADPCVGPWFGVTCDATGSITNLDLYDFSSVPGI